jgi:tetratricopeptide (TPR) repeat protein
MRTTSILFIAAVLVACGAAPTPTTDASATPPATTAKTDAVAKTDAPKPVKPKPKTRTYDEEIADADLRISGSRKLAEDQPTSYLAADRVANNFLARARLTGDYNDYRFAEEWIDKAFAMSASRGRDIGPHGTRASLNYTLHRLDRVDADFERSKLGPKDNVTVSGQKAFAGNLALQRGKYDEAARLLDESVALHEDVGNLASKAYFILGTGDVDGSEALYRKAIGMYHGSSKEPMAWLHLQLGLSDLGRGRYDDALAHYREAETHLSGYWLIDEHIAEILTLTGKVEDAKKLYLDIIARTNNPEFMDAMAGIMLEEGNKSEADAFVAKARARYEELMAMYPEASYGHALEHFLEFGEDAKATIDMAEKNHALRPNADAKMLLAQAYLKGERGTDAKRVIEEALATPWRTADLHAVAAEVYRAVGDAANADAQLALAKAINPKIE